MVEIDLGPGQTEVAQPGWNLFELRGSGPEESEARVEAVVDAFASALGWGERSTRAINLMTQAASALATVARLVDPAIAPTIFQIPTLLTGFEPFEIPGAFPCTAFQFRRATFEGHGQGYLAATAFPEVFRSFPPDAEISKTVVRAIRISPHDTGDFDTEWVRDQFDARSAYSTTS